MCIRDRGKAYRSLLFMYQENFKELKDVISVAEACQWKINSKKGNNVELGKLYLDGWRLDLDVKGAPNPFLINPDTAKATSYFETAAKKGNAEGMYFLGKAYSSNSSSARDPSKAMQWYLKSAELGNVDAQVALANAFEAGEIVEQNYNEAAKWHLVVMEGRYYAAVTSHIRLAQLYTNGQLKGTNSQEFEKRLKSATARGLQSRFESRASWQSNRKEEHDIQFFASLYRLLVKEALARYAKYPLLELKRYATAANVSLVDQIHASTKLMILASDRVVDDHKKWRSRLELLAQKSRKVFLDAGARKKTVSNVAWNILELGKDYRLSLIHI